MGVNPYCQKFDDARICSKDNPSKIEVCDGVIEWSQVVHATDLNIRLSRAVTDHDCVLGVTRSHEQNNLRSITKWSALRAAKAHFLTYPYAKVFCRLVGGSPEPS